jgi:CRP-like cAMP-binding protein
MKGRPPEHLIESLGEVPLFATLNRKDLLTVVRLGEFVSFDPGERIFGEGERGLALYIVLDGEVKVTMKGSSLHLGKGESFGEMSGPIGQPWSAEVIATRPTRCFAFSEWSFESLVHLFPQVQKAMK